MVLANRMPLGEASYHTQRLEGVVHWVEAKDYTINEST
jgi:hypothetical protein